MIKELLLINRKKCSKNNNENKFNIKSKVLLIIIKFKYL